MIQLTQNNRAWVPVRLFDNTTGTPIQGVTFADITVLIVKGDTTEAAYSVSSGAFVEHATSPANTSGLYQLNLLVTDTNVTGSLVYVAKSSASRAYIGSVYVTPPADLVSLSASLRSEILQNRDILSGAFVNTSASLRTEILTSRDILSGTIVNLSSSLRQESLTGRDLISGSIALTSASLRSEIISGGGVSTLSASIVTLSSSLRTEELSTRSILSGAIITTSASLGTQIATFNSASAISSVNILAGISTISAQVQVTGSLVSGSIALTSGSLRTEILSNRSILSASIVTTSASLRTEILSNGGGNTTAVLSASIVTLSSSLRTEILQTRDILSASIVTTSASLWTQSAAVSSSLGQALTRNRSVNEGNWKIFKTGPDTGKMVFTDLLGNVLFKQALSGSDGNINVDVPFERNSVP